LEKDDNDLTRGSLSATMDTIPLQRVSAAARLDRLPIVSFHRHIMWLLGFCFFFELGDINTFAFAAPAIRAQWGISIQTIGLVTDVPMILVARANFPAKDLTGAAWQRWGCQVASEGP
jgi:hypothetical protein